MSKLLVLSDADRVGCVVVFNVNRFEVYHASGWLIAAAQTKESLQTQLKENGIEGAKFDAGAQREYLKGAKAAGSAP